jgi:hypothetical protein
MKPIPPMKYNHVHYEETISGLQAPRNHPLRPVLTVQIRSLQLTTTAYQHAIGAEVCELHTASSRGTTPDI